MKGRMMKRRRVGVLIKKFLKNESLLCFPPGFIIAEEEFSLRQLL